MYVINIFVWDKLIVLHIPEMLQETLENDILYSYKY